jgi:hypothetical protein
MKCISRETYAYRGKKGIHCEIFFLLCRLREMAVDEAAEESSLTPSLLMLRPPWTGGKISSHEHALATQVKYPVVAQGTGQKRPSALLRWKPREHTAA